MDDKTLPKMNQPIPTLNRFGYQLASPSPLLQTWLESYDGTHPLLDIGCAYGINALKAAEKGIPVVAIDPERKHLEILREKLDKQTLHLVECVVGALPHDIVYPEDSFSGILCSELFHFLDGRQIEESIQTMHKKLVSGGKLLMTSLSTNYLKHVHPEKEITFHKEFEEGVKWPGMIKCDDDFVQRIERAAKSEHMQSTVRKVAPDFLHILSAKQMTMELMHCGFVEIKANLGDHPGFPDVEGTRILPGQQLQVVAKKM